MSREEKNETSDAAEPRVRGALIKVASCAAEVASQNSETASPALQRALAKLDFALDDLDAAFIHGAAQAATPKEESGSAPHAS